MVRRPIAAFVFLWFQLLAQVSPRTAPCSDFYRYACRRWPAGPSSSDQLRERNSAVIREILEAEKPGSQLGDFYASCMDERANGVLSAPPVVAILKRIDAIQNKQAITGELIALHRAQVSAFFRFGSSGDKQVVTSIDQGGLTLPDRDDYFKTGEKDAALRARFAAYSQKLWELSGDSAELAAAKSRTVLRLETDLASHSIAATSYHNYTVAELISLSPGIDWQKFFAGMGVGAITTLNVAAPPFVRRWSPCWCRIRLRISKHI